MKYLSLVCSSLALVALTGCPNNTPSPETVSRPPTNPAPVSSPTPVQLKTQDDYSDSEKALIKEKLEEFKALRQAQSNPNKTYTLQDGQRIETTPDYVNGEKRIEILNQLASVLLSQPTRAQQELDSFYKILTCETPAFAPLTSNRSESVFEYLVRLRIPRGYHAKVSTLIYRIRSVARGRKAQLPCISLRRFTRGAPLNQPLIAQTAEVDSSRNYLDEDHALTSDQNPLSNQYYVFPTIHLSPGSQTPSTEGRVEIALTILLQPTVEAALAQASSGLPGRVNVLKIHTVKLKVNPVGSTTDQDSQIFRATPEAEDESATRYRFSLISHQAANELEYTLLIQPNVVVDNLTKPIFEIPLSRTDLGF